MEVIDFDELFAAYLSKWYRANKEKYPDIEELEERAGTVFDEWADKPLKAAGGLSPRAYFAASEDGKALAALLLKYTAADISVPDLLVERLKDTKDAAPYLLELFKRSENAELRSLCAHILDAAGYAPSTDAYVDALFGTAAPEIKELAAASLSQDADAAAVKILDRLDAADGGVPAYASYLGRYGDPRALGTLIAYGSRQDINYLQFTETRAAVEALGGDLDNPKDFKKDKYYRLLKDA